MLAVARMLTQRTRDPHEADQHAGGHKRAHHDVVGAHGDITADAGEHAGDQGHGEDLRKEIVDEPQKDLFGQANARRE